MLKYYRKKDFDKNVRPADMVVFVYVSMHKVEIVKYIDYNWCIQLAWLSRWNTSKCSAWCVDAIPETNMDCYV